MKKKFVLFDDVFDVYFCLVSKQTKLEFLTLVFQNIFLSSRRFT